MAKCKNCNKPVPDGATFCGHCGKPTGFEPNYLPPSPFKQYNVTPYGQNAEKEVSTAVVDKPNCDLSVAGFIMSLLTPFFIIAFILSCVALGKKQLRRGLAIAGLVLSLVEMVAVAVGIYVALFVLPQMGIYIWEYIRFLIP